MSHSSIRRFFLSFVLLTSAVVRAGDAASATPEKLRLLAHRLQFVSVDGITHFRYMDNNPGEVTARDVYYKVSTVVRINLRGEGATYVQARGESGRSFAASYDYTGIGMHDRYWSFNLKSLFVGQRIGPHWEIQAGSIEFDRGAGTEATYADNDGWLEAYRLRYSKPRYKFLPDLISATVGYAGDFKQPNAFARFHRMGDENYIQLLARKQLGKNRDVSAEFDSLQGIRYTREAVHLQKLPLVAVDEMIAEAITRASDDSSFGWSGSLFRTLDRKGRVRLGAFVSDLPKRMFLKDAATIFLNGDSYVLGQRMGPTVRIIPVKNLEVSLFGSGRLDGSSTPRYRGQIAVRYQFTDLLSRALQ